MTRYGEGCISPGWVRENENIPTPTCMGRGQPCKRAPWEEQSRKAGLGRRKGLEVGIIYIYIYFKEIEAIMTGARREW